MGIVMYLLAFIIMSGFTLKLWKLCNYNSISMIVVYVGTAVLFFLALLISKVGYVIDNSKSIGLKNITKTHEKTPEFLSIYKKLYNEKIKDLEKKRIIARISKIVLDISFYFACIGYASDLNPIYAVDNVSFNNFYDKFQSSYALICIILAISAFAYIFAKFVYTNSYKKEVIPSLIKLINKNLEYSSKFEEKMKKDYGVAKFDDEPYDFYSEDDHIFGKLDDNIEINLSDIKVKRIGRSKSEEPVVVLFDGIFAYTKTKREYENDIIVNAIGKNFDRQNLPYKVELDNREFEHKFDVYCENRVLPMRILTADVMEDLLEFSKKLDIVYEMTFRKDTIYFRFYTGNMFEPRIKGNALDKEYIYSYYEILEFIINITKKINDVVEDINL